MMVNDDQTFNKSHYQPLHFWNHLCSVINMSPLRANMFSVSRTTHLTPEENSAKAVNGLGASIRTCGTAAASESQMSSSSSSGGGVICLRNPESWVFGEVLMNIAISCHQQNWQVTDSHVQEHRNSAIPTRFTQSIKKATTQPNNNQSTKHWTTGLIPSSAHNRPAVVYHPEIKCLAWPDGISTRPRDGTGDLWLYGIVQEWFYPQRSWFPLWPRYRTRLREDLLHTPISCDRQVCRTPWQQ